MTGHCRQLQAYKFDLLLTSCVSGLVKPLSFCLADESKGFIKFFSQTLEFREEIIIFMKVTYFSKNKCYFWIEKFSLISCFRLILSNLKFCS